MVQEQPVRFERRLSAILVADVAGYSRLMNNDEEATHSKVKALLSNAVAPAIAAHGGHIVKNTGDGFVAEFPSAVEAVRAAVQFQDRISELTSGDVQDRRIAFRVGITIGDVIVEPHDIFGDGVNVAARLESIARPGGICISSSVYDYVRDKVRVDFTDLGDQNLKNIDRAVRVFAVVRDKFSADAPNSGAPSSPTLAPRLSIVVLPFANISGDHEQDHFVDGVTESLTTDLSRISGSFIIGRHTAFTYKGKGVGLKQIGRELNVRYVLEGSVQRAGSRLRVNVQLIDAHTGNQLWAERFDKAVSDLFDMQDEIASRLANTLDTQLITAEARRAEHSLQPDAMELYFQGRAWANKGPTPEHMAQATSFYHRALAIDPGNIEASIGAAHIDTIVATNYLTDDRLALLAAAEAAVTKVLSVVPQHALAHHQLGVIQIHTNRAPLGISECQQALALDRNMAGAHGSIAMAKNFIGRADETEAHVHEALRLSPRDVYAPRWMVYVGYAKMQLGADADAVAWLRRSIEANRNFPFAHFYLAAVLAQLGSFVEARAVAQIGLALQPSFTIRRFRANAPTDNPTYVAGRERVYEGMRIAGVPEG